jgi:hypothetical protein
MIEGLQKTFVIGQCSDRGQCIRLLPQSLNLFGQSFQVSKQKFLGAANEFFGLLFLLFESRCLQKKMGIGNHPISDFLGRFLITMEEQIEVPATQRLIG